MCNKIAELHNALEKLKKDYPMEYEIIQLYYFSEKKITQQEIGSKRHITKQAVNKILKNAYEHLKRHIIINKNKDWKLCKNTNFGNEEKNILKYQKHGWLLLRFTGVL